MKKLDTRDAVETAIDLVKSNKTSSWDDMLSQYRRRNPGSK